MIRTKAKENIHAGETDVEETDLAKTECEGQDDTNVNESDSGEKDQDEDEDEDQHGQHTCSLE